MNNTLVEKVRCILLSSNLSKHFWVEAVVAAAYLINRSPSLALEFKTPQEVWSGKPPDLSNLKIFGCPAYAHISQGKLEPKAVKGYFIGYHVGIISYALVVTRNVTSEEPDNFKQAMRNKDKTKWMAAMEEEMASLKKNNIWTLVKKSVDQKLLGCKWIYKLKE